MRKQQYNPAKYSHQDNIADNFKRLYRDKYREECTLPNRDVWEAYEECYGVVDSDNPDLSSDDITVEFLYELQHGK